HPGSGPSKQQSSLVVLVRLGIRRPPVAITESPAGRQSRRLIPRLNADPHNRPRDHSRAPGPNPAPARNIDYRSTAGDARLNRLEGRAHFTGPLVPLPRLLSE